MNIEPKIMKFDMQPNRLCVMYNTIIHAASIILQSHHSSPLYLREARIAPNCCGIPQSSPWTPSRRNVNRTEGKLSHHRDWIVDYICTTALPWCRTSWGDHRCKNYLFTITTDRPGFNFADRNIGLCLVVLSHWFTICNICSGLFTIVVVSVMF